MSTLAPLIIASARRARQPLPGFSLSLGLGLLWLGL
ncbi:MAG: hypothetical protein JWL98_1858, partial [Xanthomonadaceae bacterium]|nr:hypothetical protein [Xanthomonadaceae bacterium]